MDPEFADKLAKIQTTLCDARTGYTSVDNRIYSKDVGLLILELERLQECLKNLEIPSDAPDTISSQPASENSSILE